MESREWLQMVLQSVVMDENSETGLMCLKPLAGFHGFVRGYYVPVCTTYLFILRNINTLYTFYTHLRIANNAKFVLITPLEGFGYPQLKNLLSQKPSQPKIVRIWV